MRTSTLLFLCTSVAAQAPTRAIDPGAAISQAHGLRADAAGAAGFGPTYVVDFTRDRVVYTPALGERAPRSLPLSLHLLGVGRDQPAPVAAAALRVDGNDAVYDRGSVRERFAVREDGVAFSVRLDHAPSGGGDLVVRYAVERDTAAAPQATSDGGLRFAVPGIGGVAVGCVTGIDADGRRAAGSLRCEGDHLDLVLPEAFVRQARYPLLVDPVLTTEVNLVTNSWVAEPDAAYDPQSNSYLVVWRGALSGAEWRTFGAFVDGTTGAAGFSMLIESLSIGNGQSRRPAVVYVPAAGRFLVAWPHGPSEFGPFDATIIAVNSNGVMSNRVTAFGPIDEIVAGGCVGQHVALAMTARPATGEGILVATFKVPPTGDPSYVNGGTCRGLYYHAPTMARSPSANGDFAVAWVDSTPGAEQIAAMTVRIDAAGNFTSTPVVPVATAANGGAIGHVDIDGDGTQFAVAWDEYENQLANERDVFCQRLLFNGSTLQTVGGPLPQATTAGEDTHYPAIAFLGPKYGLAWTRTIPGTGSVVEGRDLSPACTACSRPWALTLTNQLQGTPRFATQRAGGASTSVDALLVCIDDEIKPPNFLGAVHAAKFNAFGPGGTVTPVGNPCGTAGIATATGGPLAVGNLQYRIELKNVPNGALVAADVGLPGGELVCGSCTITNGLAITPVMPQNGVYRFGLPLPCKPVLFGVTLSTQWLVFGGGGAACPIAPNWGVTRRLHLTIGE